MRSVWRSGSSVFLLSIVLACRAQPEKVIAEWRTDPALRGASIGLMVREASSNATVAAHNPQLLLVPASTLKILTTAAALDILGPKYAYETTIAYTGSISPKGVLNGDLVIKGGGDPLLASPEFHEDGLVQEWARKIGQAGITRIEGKITADASLYPRIVPDHWIWADVSNYFGAVPSGLNYRENKFSIFLNSGAEGKPVTVLRTEPNYRNTKFDITCEVISRGKTDQAYVYGDPFGFTRRIGGTYPPNRKHYIEAALPDPALLCAEELAFALEAKGISSRSSESLYTQRAMNTTTLFVHRSRPLSEIVTETNQQSNNLYCESISRTLGNGDQKNGLEAVRQFWAGNGLDPAQVVFADACGLSRANAVTADFLSHALAVIARKRSLYETFERGLFVTGAGGGLSNIGKGTAIQGKMRAKSGYIERVRSYCGYIRGKSGKLYCFALMFNNYSCTPAEARVKMEKLLVSLGELP